MEQDALELLQAAMQGNLNHVSDLLIQGRAHVDVADKHGHTALLGAAVSFKRRALALLLILESKCNLFCKRFCKANSDRLSYSHRHMSCLEFLKFKEFMFSTDSCLILTTYSTIKLYWFKSLNN